MNNDQLIVRIASEMSRDTIVHFIEIAVKEYQNNPCDRTWDNLCNFARLSTVKELAEESGSPNNLLGRLKSTKDAVKLFNRLYDTDKKAT